jgi:hypothetical protein
MLARAWRRVRLGNMARPRRRRSEPDDEPDVNQIAYRTILQATGSLPEPAKVAEPVPEKNPAAVALGKLGGSKGGVARAAALSPKRRTAIAKKAARARWGKDT